MQASRRHADSPVMSLPPLPTTRSDDRLLVNYLIDIFRVEAPGSLPEPRCPEPAEQYAANPESAIDFPDLYRELRALGG